MADQRQNWMRSQPGGVAVAILFVLFAADLIAGLSHAPMAGMQVVVGATGMFGCVALFVIGFVINRLL